jgi:DNA processing protein
MHDTLVFQIALTLIPGVGPITAKNLVAYCGSAEAVFREKEQALMKIPDIGKMIAHTIRHSNVMERAEKEIAFIEANSIVTHFFTDSNYPDRLKQCEDGPALIYTKGTMNLSEKRVISVIGTRNSTSYGKRFCKELLEGITHLKPLVVSGLAYGIDICGHRNAVMLNLQTVACVAHGLDKVYPAMHIPVANDMMRNGGLVSEFPSDTKMTPDMFPMRNRIIAGLSDCTIVVETDLKGGSIITAHLANSYAREVFALPGRYHDRYSAGCNALIRKNLAAIINSPQDLIDYMNWDDTFKPKSKQLPLFQELNPDETLIVDLLTQEGKISIDLLSHTTGIGFSKLSNVLLDLEFRGIIKSLPGKRFELI